MQPFGLADADERLIGDQLMQAGPGDGLQRRAGGEFARQGHRQRLDRRRLFAVEQGIAAVRLGAHESCTGTS